MDSRTVQSSSKCSSSDFSIKSILGEGRSSQEERTTALSWLCCTRYQPPRLPRSNNTAVSRARRSGRHARVPFTAAQAAALEAAYARAPYLAPPALRALAAALQLRDDRIKIWFQNRRARERREKNGEVTPPRAVTLQPTNVSRVAPSQDLLNSWSRLHSTLGNNTTLLDYRHSNLDNNTPASSSVTSVDSYPALNYSSQSNSNISDISIDNNRSDSPVDIETIDS